MIYKSKVDLWIGILIFAVVPAVSLYAIFEAYQSSGSSNLYVSVGCFAMYIVTLFALIFPLNYALSEQGLEIRHGLIRRHIKYDSIRGVTPSSNPLSSPALSLKRLHIDLGTFSSVLISPERRNEFIQQLNTRCSHLQLSDDQQKLVNISAYPTDQ